MNVTYTTPSGRIRIEFEHTQVQDAFEALAAVSEVLDAEAQCGLCQSKAIRHLVRHVGKDTYYELECQEPTCGGRFAFGQLRAGGLYPKRRDADGKPLPKRGWSLRPNAQHDDAPAGQPADAPSDPHQNRAGQEAPKAAEPAQGQTGAKSGGQQNGVWDGPGQCPRCHAPQGKRHGKPCA